MNIKRLIYNSVVVVILSTLIISFIPLRVNAFGDYNDYDYDYDYGYDYGYDYDYDYDYGYDYDYDYDGGYSGGGYSRGSSSSSDMGIFYIFFFILKTFGPVPAIIFIVVIFIIGRIMSKRNGRGNMPGKPNYYNDLNSRSNQPKKRFYASTYHETKKQAHVTKNMPNRTNEIENIIKQRDELFTEPDFITYVKDVYIDIQGAWCKRDLTEVQAVLHSNLYARTKNQLERKIADNIVPHLERLTVNEAYLTGYKIDNEYEYLTVFLSSSMVDYQTRGETDNIICGDRETVWEMHYLMTFMRTVSQKTPKMGAASRAFNCPNCAGTIDGINFGICPYCGSTVKSGDYGWVLSDFNQVKDDTPDIGIKINNQ